MQKEKVLAIVIVLLVQTIHTQVQGACGTCNVGNGIACVSENTYHICVNDVPDKTMTHSCGSDEICTSLGVVCAPKTSSIQPLCSAPKCGTCTTDGFTCLSKTKFGLCVNGELSNIRGNCSSGYVCNTDVNELCKAACKSVPSCDIPD